MNNIKNILITFIGMLLLTSSCHAQANPEMPVGEYEKVFGHRILGITRYHSKETPSLLYIKDTVRNSVDTVGVNVVPSPSVFDSYLDSEKIFFITNDSPIPICLVFFEKGNGRWSPPQTFFLFDYEESALDKYGIDIKIIDRDHILYQKGSPPTKYRIDFKKKTLVEEI